MRSLLMCLSNSLLDLNSAAQGYTFLLITKHLIKVLGKYIQCFNSVYHIFSYTAEDDALVNSLEAVEQVLLVVKGISTEATGKCPFPNMFCSM